MYESPITIMEKQICRDVEKTIEGEVWKTIGEVNIHVDKDELIKALEYDRDQYNQGYQDAKNRYFKVGHWIERRLVTDEIRTGDRHFLVCSLCHLGIPKGLLGFANFCPSCGAKMEEE